MTSIINLNSFEKTGDDTYWENGTVEVTLRGKTKRVPARRWTMNGKDEITAHGMTGRYQTGTVNWPASVTAVTDPRTGEVWDRIMFGRDDRASKFQKRNALSFDE
jgi:hypothetical protein